MDFAEEEGLAGDKYERDCISPDTKPYDYMNSTLIFCNEHYLLV